MPTLHGLGLQAAGGGHPPQKLLCCLESVSPAGKPRRLATACPTSACQELTLDGVPPPAAAAAPLPERSMRARPEGVANRWLFCREAGCTGFFCTGERSAAPKP